MLTKEFGRYGYRMITGMLNNSGWHVNHKRVERIWRREGLKVPQKQPKKGRLWLNDGSCVRLRPERKNHVWSYDFVQDRTHDGRIFRTLNIIDEFTKEALTIKVKRRLNSTDVVDALTDLFILRGPPEFIRSDNVLCRNIWLIWHQVIVVSRRLNTFKVWLSSAFWSTTVSPITNTEYAFAALTVLKTRSSGR